ncbi:unnamed protein product [Thelazia callipaeda]|uniref:Bromo domain-containing protein n=1 Tax=Thelazia callipaeda TaxID=103827 RepID=A0A0N5D2H7_THECL|nr:unnamed protein product [Thelazia callipaeda]
MRNWNGSDDWSLEETLHLFELMEIESEWSERSKKLIENFHDKRPNEFASALRYAYLTSINVTKSQACKDEFERVMSSGHPHHFLRKPGEKYSRKELINAWVVYFQQEVKNKKAQEEQLLLVKLRLKADLFNRLFSSNCDLSDKDIKQLLKEAREEDKERDQEILQQEIKVGMKNLKDYLALHKDDPAKYPQLKIVIPPPSRPLESCADEDSVSSFHSLFEGLSIPVHSRADATRYLSVVSEPSLPKTNTPRLPKTSVHTSVSKNTEKVKKPASTRAKSQSEKRRTSTTKTKNIRSDSLSKSNTEKEGSAVLETPNKTKSHAAKVRDKNEVIPVSVETTGKKEMTKSHAAKVRDKNEVIPVSVETTGKKEMANFHCTITKSHAAKVRDKSETRSHAAKVRDKSEVIPVSVETSGKKESAKSHAAKARDKEIIPVSVETTGKKEMTKSHAAKVRDKSEVIPVSVETTGKKELAKSHAAKVRDRSEVIPVSVETTGKKELAKSHAAKVKDKSEVIPVSVETTGKKEITRFNCIFRKMKTRRVRRISARSLGESNNVETSLRHNRSSSTSGGKVFGTISKGEKGTTEDEGKLRRSERHQAKVDSEVGINLEPLPPVKQKRENRVEEHDSSEESGKKRRRLSTKDIELAEKNNEHQVESNIEIQSSPELEKEDESPSNDQINEKEKDITLEAENTTSQAIPNETDKEREEADREIPMTQSPGVSGVKSASRRQTRKGGECDAEQKALMITAWRMISSHKHAAIFAHPVSDKDARSPMDLSTLKKMLDNGTLKDMKDFKRNLILMFANAVMFNSTGHEVNTFAKEMAADTLSALKSNEVSLSFYLSEVFDRLSSLQMLQKDVLYARGTAHKTRRSAAFAAEEAKFERSRFTTRRSTLGTVEEPNRDKSSTNFSRETSETPKNVVQAK